MLPSTFGEVETLVDIVGVCIDLSEFISIDIGGGASGDRTQWEDLLDMEEVEEPTIRSINELFGGGALHYYPLHVLPCYKDT